MTGEIAKPQQQALPKGSNLCAIMLSSLREKQCRHTCIKALDAENHQQVLQNWQQAVHTRQDGSLLEAYLSFKLWENSDWSEPNQTVTKEKGRWTSTHRVSTL